MIGCAVLMATNSYLLYARLIPVDRCLPPALFWLLLRDFLGYFSVDPWMNVAYVFHGYVINQL